MPPDAKTYPQPRSDLAAVRFDLESAVASKPRDMVAVDLFVTSSYEFVGYLAAGRFPREYLTLERVEILTTTGSKGMDNERGEFWILSSNSLRRMGAEGEKVHAGRLYFKVSEAARDLEEVRISLGDVRVGERLVYVNRVTVLEGNSQGELLAKVEVPPIVLGDALVKLKNPGTLRGDANFDGQFDLSDPVTVISYAFLGGQAPECANAADFNLDQSLDLTDPITMLATLFLGAEAPGGPEPREIPCN